MNKSPFEALTSRERQERWLEFQSIRLPYVRAGLDVEDAREEPKEEAPKPAAVPTAPQPASRERAAFQAARHKQYDAVIKRMRDASRQASVYRSPPFP